jgi:phosphoribosyl 1,2-cyclic phosphodiesterase
MADGFEVRFWGVRGSVPVSGPGTEVHGGDTTCLEIRCGDALIVVDLGTGARRLGEAIAAEGRRDVTVLLSHGHYDHVIGLPFFQPLRDPRARVDLISAAPGGTERLVRELLRPPFFPVGVDSFLAEVNYRDVEPDGTFEVGPATVRLSPTHHAGTTTAFRIEFGGRSVVTLFDHETGDAATDARLAGFARGADLVILDATGAAPFAAGRGGHGHSTAADALALGMRAEARGIALAHHHPSSEDAGLARLDEDVRSRRPGAFVARAGDVFDVAAGRLVRT